MTHKIHETPKFNTEALRTPECIDCFDRIATHANDVMGMFEVHTEELIDHFNIKTDNAVKQMEVKTDEAISSYLQKQEQKHDKSFESHLVKQGKKHDEYLDRKEKKETRTFNVNMGIISFLALVIGYSYLRQDAMQSEMKRLEHEIEVKPSKNEVPTMNEIKMLRELGDEYNRNVFVRKQLLTADTSAYFWAKINIYGSTLRGSVGSKYYKEDYDKAMKEKEEKVD